MNKIFLHKEIWFYSLLAIVISLPFSIKLNGFFILTGLAISLLTAKRSTVKNQLVENKRIFTIALIALIMLVGLCYTFDMRSGLALLERMFPTIAIPIIIAIIPSIKPSDKRLIFFLFSVTCTAIGVYCIINAGLEVYSSGSWINESKLADRPYYYFTNIELIKPFPISPIYFSLYINFCICFLALEYFINNYKAKLYIVLLVILIFIQILVFSINGILSFVIFSLLFVGIILYRKNFSRKRIVGASVIFSVVLVAMVVCFKPFRNRLFVSLEYNIENKHIGFWNGMTLRLAVWKCSAEVIQENLPFGVGTGDANNTLLEKYEQKKFFLGHLSQLDSHNQFLQYLIMFGVLGPLLLILIFAYTFRIAWKENNYLLLAFLGLCCLGFQTECLLNTQKGIVFFSLFYSLLYKPASLCTKTPSVTSSQTI